MSSKQIKDDKTAHHSIYELYLDDSYYSGKPEELEKVLEELNDKFASLGIKLSANKKSLLRMDIHEEKFASCTARHVGRKKKKSNKMLEEILEYRKTHTPKQTADWLGLTPTVQMIMLTTTTKTIWTAESSTARMMPGTRQTMTLKTETPIGDVKKMYSA